MKRFLPACAVICAILCLSAGPKDAAEKKAVEKALQGTWKWVSVVDQGEEQPWPEANRLVITPDVMKVVYPKDDPMGWKYKIDASKDPCQLDMLPEEDPGRPIHQAAIFSVEGDNLKICFAAAGKPRPTKFVSKKGDSGGLWILKRVAPDPKT